MVFFFVSIACARIAGFHGTSAYKLRHKHYSVAFHMSVSFCYCSLCVCQFRTMQK